MHSFEQRLERKQSYIPEDLCKQLLFNKKHLNASLHLFCILLNGGKKKSLEMSGRFKKKKKSFLVRIKIFLINLVYCLYLCDDYFTNAGAFVNCSANLVS